MSSLELSFFAQLRRCRSPLAGSSPAPRGNCRRRGLSSRARQLPRGSPREADSGTWRRLLSPP
eukprot:8441815-Pyramimonas_sp.AAC.1